MKTLSSMMKKKFDWSLELPFTKIYSNILGLYTTSSAYSEKRTSSKDPPELLQV